MTPNTMNTKNVITWLILITGLTLRLEAAFQVQPNSVRAHSLGGAFMASANESSAIFLNPSGISRIPTSELSFTYSKPYAGLNDINLGVGSFAFVWPTRLGSFGVGYGSFMASGIKQERTSALSYANTFTIFGRDLNLGVTGKHLYHNYTIGSDPAAARDPIFSKGTSQSAMSFDAGLSATIVGPVKFGLALRNINQPDVGLITEDIVPRELQAGLTIDIRGLGVMLNTDLFYRNTGLSGNKNQLLSLFGLEKGLHDDRVMLRLGGNLMEYTAGIGLRLGSVRFDYGVVLNRNLMQDNIGTHQLGMIFRFGE